MPEAYRSKVTVARKPPGLNRQKNLFCEAFGDSQGACLRGRQFMHGLIDAGLIGAECAAPLEHKSDAIASIRTAGMQGSTLAQGIWRRRRRDIVHGRIPAGSAVEFASLQEPHDAAMTDLAFPPVLETGFRCHTIVEAILEVRATRTGRSGESDQCGARLIIASTSMICESTSLQLTSGSQ
jgi:hypothetical protein